MSSFMLLFEKVYEEYSNNCFVGLWPLYFSFFVSLVENIKILKFQQQKHTIDPMSFKFLQYNLNKKCVHHKIRPLSKILSIVMVTFDLMTPK